MRRSVKLMLIFFVYMIGLLGTFALIAGGLTYIVVALADRRPCPLRVPAGILCGYVAGARFVWSLAPRDWKLPFWTTLAASVDAAKYGHPVEHYAEGIVIWILFGAVGGAVLGGFAAGIAGRLPTGCRVAQARASEVVWRCLRSTRTRRAG